MVATAETLGHAERVIQILLNCQDHMVHSRRGIIVPDPHAPQGARWYMVTSKKENGAVVIYKKEKNGKGPKLTKMGTLGEDNLVREGVRVVGRYQKSGIMSEMAAWMYRNVAEVWKLDNEFAARWASYAYPQEHKDLKAVLTAFMLCQSRVGAPTYEEYVENGQVKKRIAFCDDDYRQIGEAMLLLKRNDGRGMDAKYFLRVYHILREPLVAQINRELGFGISTRRPTLGRWEKVAHKWLKHLEDNPNLLRAEIKKGFRRTLMQIAQKSRYKPESVKFFETLRWPQKNAPDGRRSMAIGTAVAAAETWEDLSEKQICEKILKTRPSYKRITSLVPVSIGLTRAIVAAAVEAGSFSNKDLINASETLEELGLLEVQTVKEKWLKATSEAENMRAANIATRVKSKETREILEKAADTALQKTLAEVMKDVRIYFMIDRSGSMEGSIEKSKLVLARLLQGFPMKKLHVSQFNSTGQEVRIAHASAAGVENALRGIRASGGTDYGAGVRALRDYKPLPNEDAVFFFCGDEEAATFDRAVRECGFNPVAFGLIKVWSGDSERARQVADLHRCVRQTAVLLGIPCFQVDLETFADPYAIPRTIRNLIAATPVVQAAKAPTAPSRVTLAEQIAKTEFLKLPTWAARAA
jgi:hypothetical protein